MATLEVADESKVAYLTQTTLSVDDANRIIRRLKERFPQIAAPPKDDICYATQNRQEAVSRLSDEADLVLVLGSQNSSNSQRLAELARERGIPAHLIDGPDDIDPAWFDGVEHGAGHRRRERPGSRRRSLPRLAPRPIRRDGRAALDPRGERLVPAAARAAQSGRQRVTPAGRSAETFRPGLELHSGRGIFRDQYVLPPETLR